MSPTDLTQYTQMRRKDRAIQDDEWIVDFLRTIPFGSLATVADGQPFLHTNLFVYDAAAHALYFHTARDGRTPRNLAASGRVCFSAAQMGRLLPNEVALEFSVEFSSVVAFGTACLVANEAEAVHALQLLLDKYFPHLHPGKDYRPITEDERQATAVYRIDVEEWSVKRIAVAEDFPGAFFWKDRPAG